MKKLFYLLFLMIFTVHNAQTIAETVDWLNTKKSEVTGTSSYAVQDDVSNKITFNSQMVKIEGTYVSTFFAWDKIVDFRVNEEKSTPGLYLISSNMEDGLPLYIILNFQTEEMRDRFKKAIQHITDLKGNSLVKFNGDSTEDQINWLNAKAIDLFEGESKQRVSYTSSGIKIFFLKDKENYTIYWDKIKNISYSLYDKNKKYYMILIQSSEATSGTSKEKKIYVSKFVGETYGKLLKSLAQKKGAKLIDENLF